MFARVPFLLNKKLKSIKLVAMDFDGVLTDGGIYLGNENLSFRKFNTKDGMGIKILQSLSIKLAIISGSNSMIINRRADNLGIKIIKKAVKNKGKALENIQNKYSINKEETLFLGDDVNDLSVIPKVKLFFTPLDGHISCKKKANFIGNSKGGNGFLREVIDKILIANNKNPYEEFSSRNEFSD